MAVIASWGRVKAARLITRQAKLDLYWQIGLLAVSLAAFTLPQEAMTAIKWFSAGYTALYVVYLLLQWRAAGGQGNRHTPPSA